MGFAVVLLMRPQGGKKFAMQRTHRLSYPGHVFLCAPQAVLHLHTIYTARLVFSIAGL